MSKVKFKVKDGVLDIIFGGGVKVNGNRLLDIAYPVGTLFISKNSTSPSSILGGTWEQLSADAYFKIVTSNGGSLGGTSSGHKIPVASMPSHTHTKYMSDGTETNEPLVQRIPHFVWNKHGQVYIDTEASGGGQPYYPYYYGVYAWIRIS